MCKKNYLLIFVNSGCRGLRLRFTSFSIAMKLSQSSCKPFAFENHLPFLLICRFSSVLIHGRFCHEPDSLEGMSVFKSPSMNFLNIT